VLFVKQFPVTPGAVSAELLRNGKSVLSLTAPELIASNPFREDNGIYSFSTDYGADWKLDFPGVQPLHYSEYGDADNDGLPNWFEMYWQKGKWLDFKSQEALNPSDAPEGSGGRTYLQSYQQRKNPFKADASYAPGFVWNLFDIPKSNSSFNPDPDSQGSDVWSYLYRHGAYGKMDRLGEFSKCPYSGYNVGYTGGKMAHLSPYKDDAYQYIHGWTAWAQTKDASAWLLNIKPRREAMIAVGWTAPVSGSFKASVAVASSSKEKIWFGVLNQASGKLVAEAVLDNPEAPTRLETEPLKLEKGQSLLFEADSFPGNGGNGVSCSELKIELLPGN
jgi:hypothetical protein